MRRFPALIASCAIVLSSLALASPANAAPVVDLQAASTTVTAGDPVELSWTSTDTDPDADPPVTLTATGDWPQNGAKAANGSEDVPTTVPGELTFTLTADDDDPSTDDPTSTVTVTVTAVDPVTEVTPTAPVANTCTFTIPDLAGVTYAVDQETLEPDSYLSFFYADDNGVVTISATADSGFVLADGAEDTFQIQLSDDCLDFEFPDVVDVSAGCESVTFTNISDVPASVSYGDEDADDPAGEFALDVGETRTVESRSSTTAYVALDPSLGDLDDLNDLIESDDPEALDQLIAVLSSAEFGDISVRQGCGASHPTVAPAAGV